MPCTRSGRWILRAWWPDRVRPVRRVAIRRPDGTTIRAVDATKVTAAVGEPAVVVLRPALFGALHLALGPDAIHLGSDARSFESTPDGVRVTLENGRSHDGDVLVGADGLKSVVRHALHPQESPLRASGLVGIRGVADGVSHVLGELTGLQFLGGGLEAGIARAGGSTVIGTCRCQSPRFRETLDSRSLSSTG